jgi:hypothetical protein
VCPIKFNFLLFIWISIVFCLVILHSSLFVILSVHFIFIIRLKHLFINVCNRSGYYSFLIYFVFMKHDWFLRKNETIKVFVLFGP